MTGRVESQSGARRLWVERGRYFDSVFLLRISRSLEQVPGVRRAAVVMGTPANLENLARVGFDVATAAGELGLPERIRADDLVAAVEAAEDEALARAEQTLRSLLASGEESNESGDGDPATLADALAADRGLNLALISVPGAYAAAEARRALRRGLHVMLFSDNVSVEDEVALKEEAARRGLLVMGPDCGTAIVNGTPLGFANVVRRGPIGVVGASGTGIQEVTSIVDRLGGGVSQALGTGGRDLSRAVAGRSTLAALGALAADTGTGVLVVVSKAPSPEVAERVLDELDQMGKPAVVHFVGAASPRPRGHVVFADTLADTARTACRLAGGSVLDDAMKAHFPGASDRCTGILRGLFCGGTLAQEAWAILRRRGIDVRSNVATEPSFRLAAGDRAHGHALWDLGDDAFTVGRPHPMIEPDLRDAEVVRALAERDVCVVLVDCVLGYGAHADPGGSLVRAASQAEAGVRVVASVTGTDRDPQSYREQRRKLEAAGILVADSNAQAAEWAAALLGGPTREAER